MKKILRSTLFFLIPVGIICVIFVSLFSISPAVIVVLAAGIALYGLLMALMWKSSKKAAYLLLYPNTHTGRKADILRIALCISAPFYYLTFLMALLPVQHYSVWILFFFPANVMFIPLISEVADFCDIFRFRKAFFWTIYLSAQTIFFAIGRVFAGMIAENVL